MKNWLVPLVVTSFLAAPTVVHADAGTGAGVGALGGALVGSLAGPAKNRLGNSLIGAVAGGLLGYAMGNETEKQGAVVINQTLETAPSQTTTTWVNPQTNVTYLVTPQAPHDVQGRVCRDVSIQASIDGKQETLAGLSCRDENGQWQLTDRITTGVPAAGPPMVATTAPQTVVVSPPPAYVVADPYPYYYPPASGVYIYNGFGPYRHYYDGYGRRGWGYRY
ncbi:MAG: hypothetical protein HQL87_17905 [Magnetococcales bacterium]|nr:hypothetical protein [Magnetococcales bacterium]